ncbi:RNA polymerase sigma54 factor [Fervidicella metallireducens AeB]|uniref:RNA polymerase sigma54 factor n=1 Tax=Fervidicella metallireducens AeB TaxID=1403537 RepID=A0A017RWP5_9CLOT|nr:RNA polymerase factor sigma-54 [Fervidicella metallireducens]EYE89072.1 RNA polymerase sigma54 factor [Fervidicella metallireducens AeB]
MKLDFNLQLQQEQKLIMTQQLQLAVKILQLTSFELEQFCQEQLIENPMLDIDEDNRPLEDNIDIRSTLDYLDEYKESDDNQNDLYGENDYISPFTFISRKADLWEYLKEQLYLVPTTKKSRMIGEYIIDNIDENGYLTVDEKIICKQCNASFDDVANMIKIIQGFDPVGVCARDVKESLLIQTRARGIKDDCLENIILYMLEDIANNRLDKIMKETGLDREKLEGYIEIIRTLNPKPGTFISNEEIKYIIPDVIIEKVNGEYNVTINDYATPQLKINKTYKKFLSDKNSPEYRYVKNKIDSAIWLLKSIEQRKSTIKRVVESIVKFQYQYFEYDYDLKPLSLKHIADETGLHESTVSRAIKGKYVQTPKGLYEIKNFLIKGIQNNEGLDISTQKIKKKLKEIIKNENVNKPYSDQQISDIFKRENIDVSRRTIAKYREEMGIPSSSKRKNKF